ncbi:ammonium transporter [Tenuibacillus multivorans]|uniref:Ammonium transporter n=1 Tax=Tenuibacillus multivorans TaxID=237069 RepID=A0A1G9WVJ3_9BACI|nr:ammonium transporter [Tenuibacillus multivorans]GEL78404.1 ammonium transporter [Tenuibacillus multivorans]SDM88644.1 ammonium transporter, Amt family [Tenuibacillus multivorans]
MIKKLSCLTAGLILLPTMVHADTHEDLAPVIDSIDMVWMMLGALLVFFMHAGFAMVETGFTRSKNALNILMKNMMTISIASVLYFLFGFGLMFGESLGGFIGSTGFFLQSEMDQIGFFVFQAMFAATCATIISGAVAERMRLSSYLLLTLFMTGLIYPIVGHWVWGGGWLAELGFVDFAGSTVVHLTGAIGGLATVLFLGPRLGKYTKGKVNVIPGHNIPIGALGVFILWFGWFGFNGGSTLAADTSLIPTVIATTLLSASAGVVTSALYSYLKFKRIDATLTLNGALAGLVGITAGTANVSPVGAIIIGLIAGVILVEGVQLLDQVLKIDDPVGAITVHGICGIWGTIAVGLFAVEGGLFYSGDVTLLSIQAIGVISVVAWTLVVTSVVLFFVTRFGSIRVSREEEVSGLDFSEHGSTAYEATNSIYNENLDTRGEFGVGLIKRLDGIESTEPDSGHQPS